MSTPHVRTQKHNGITWMDFSSPTKEQISKAMEGRSLHPFHLDASLINGHLPQIEKEEHYVFLLLQLPVYNRAESKIEARQVSVFLAKDYLITVHPGSTSIVQKLFDACEKDAAQSDQYFQKSSGYLLYNILNKQLSDASDLIQTILQELDAIEDVVFDEHIAATYKIGQLRQRITKLKRLMDFIVTVLSDAVPHIDEYTGESLARYYRHTVSTAKRLTMLLEESKETVEIFKDADFTASTQTTNTTLAVLTMIFTLTIPATVAGAIYGMNIPLPGGIESGPWTFWGPYTTLAVILGLSVAPALFMLWYFKKKKWF